MIHTSLGIAGWLMISLAAGAVPIPQDPPAATPDAATESTPEPPHLTIGDAAPPDSSSTITVFEARQLTSGATGRNGGLLSNFVPGEYVSLSERFGHEQAVRIARFANRTLEKMHALAGSTEEFQNVSEVRRLLDIILLADEDALGAAKKSLALYEEHVPEDRGKAAFYTPQQAQEVRT